ncbi:MAG: alginate lyase family protein [Sedimentisphaerales bacterium]|nr:alginate lyase family protein [Sedimentisphaerales bacterium]
MRLAGQALDARCEAITDYRCERSPGGPHDFYSEGDYWWPDPNNPDGPYIRKDGLSNPDNFSGHRHAMIRMSKNVSALTAAAKITGQQQYSQAAARHLQVWFIDEQTKMNPHLLYAQAIKGICTGRGVGIIDTIHLAEVAQSIRVLEQMRAIDSGLLKGLKGWFAQYLDWLNSHPYGLDERNAKNNHGTCWVMQVGAFARLVDNGQVIKLCRQLFVDKLVADQIAADGSFPLELARTKPYCYSLFNLDVFGIAAHILSGPDLDLWTVEDAKGGSLKKAMAFHYPYIKDRSRWPFKKDVMYFDLFPVRMPSLLFAGLALEESRYIELWKLLDPDPTNEEVVRNLPVRQPILWC